MEKHKICCVTGHRPGGFPWDYNDKTCPEHREYLQTMHTLLEKLITEQGFDFFVCGGAIGVDTDFAETVLCLKEKYPRIKLEIAVPCENQDLKWNVADKEKYRAIKKKRTWSPFSQSGTRDSVCRNETAIWSISPISPSRSGTPRRKRAAPMAR